MEARRAAWLAHTTVGAGGRQSGQESSVFAVDVGEGGRLATGGLDTTVRVWNAGAYDRGARAVGCGAAAADSERPGDVLHALLSRHNGAVLCARWAPSVAETRRAARGTADVFAAAPQGTLHGQALLATGSDDAIVLIWQRTSHAALGEGAAAFAAAAAAGSRGVDGAHGSPAAPQGYTPDETYTVLHRLTGHASDVMGVEWSADGRFLASCGLDGSVVVWDAARGFALHRRLDAEPRRPLKGVAWDPLGAYVAAQSGDGQLYVWRTADWRPEAVFGSPWTPGAPEGYTYFARPAWSPDGRVVCVPDVVNGRDTVAALVSRATWATEQSLVGHAASVQVARFSPRLYADSGAAPDASTPAAAAPYAMLLAMGSQDGVVSVWTTTSSRPLVVVAGLFEHAVMDLCWDRADGTTLYAASYDGTVVQIRLETVAPLPVDAEDALLSAAHAEERRGPHASALSLPTSARQAQLASEPASALGTRIAALMDSGDVGFAAHIPVDAQPPSPDENVRGVARPDGAPRHAAAEPATTVSGKRRITPQLVQPAAPTAAAAAPARAAQSHASTVVIGRAARKPFLTALAARPALSAPPFEVHNGTERGAAYARVCRVDAADARRVLWEERLSCAVVAAQAFAVGEDACLIAATAAKRVLVFGPGGLRALPPAMLPAAPALFAVCPAALMAAVVLESGQLYVWRLPDLGCVVAEEIPASYCGSGDLVGLVVRDVDGDVLVEMRFATGAALLYSAQRRVFFDVQSAAERSAADAVMLDALLGRLSAAPDRGAAAAEAIRHALDAAGGPDDAGLRWASLEAMAAEVSAAALTRDRARLVAWLPALAARLARDEERQAQCGDLLALFAAPHWAPEREILRRAFASSPHPTVRRLVDV